MNLFEHFRERVIEALERMTAAGDLPAGAETSRVVVEPPREATHGDVTTNAAMVLAKPAGLKPRDLAEKLAARLAALDEVAATEIAGPGFINLRLSDAFWRARLAEIVRSGPSYGGSSMGGGAAVNVEYVSANPTGPLHVGHARGAVVGDALPRCWKRRASPSPANTTSMTPAPRSRPWRGPRTIAISRPWAPRSTSHLRQAVPGGELQYRAST